MPSHLTTCEVARILRVHRNTVSKMLGAGRFPNAFRLGNQWRIPRADVDAVVSSGRSGDKRPPGVPESPVVRPIPILKSVKWVEVKA